VTEPEPFRPGGDGEPLRVRTDAHVTLLQLDLPQQRNALSPELLAALARAVLDADADEAVRCIVIAGSEKVFASGADLRALFGAADLDAYMAPRFAHWDAIDDVRTPLVAAVSGYALGGGCELALRCDVILAAPSAVFGLPETSLGLIPGAGGTQRLQRAIGGPKALDVILSGRLLSAEEAERAGLVSRIVPQESWLEAALEVARKIAERAPAAQLLAKEAVRRSAELPLGEGLALERGLFVRAVGSDEAREGVGAFLEKRPPAWR
jgi:enoyl-CoA hydratase/carnithine racemase